MYYYNPIYHDESYDIREMMRLPQFHGLTEDEVRSLLVKIEKQENIQYETELVRRRQKERAETLKEINKEENKKTLSSDPVRIEVGIRITPTMIDDTGFAVNGHLTKQVYKFSLDGKKFYL